MLKVVSEDETVPLRLDAQPRLCSALSRVGQFGSSMIEGGRGSHRVV